MGIICIDPRADPRWKTLAEQYPHSSVFNAPAWLRVLADTYGWDPQAYIALGEDGEPRAGLAFFQIKDLIGERIVSLPFSDYCDPLGDDVDLWKTLADELLGAGCPVVMRCLHNDAPLTDERFALTKKAKWHGIDLQIDLDTLWRSLHRTARQSIEKARREGVSVHIAQDKKAVRDFFEMHLRMRKYKYHMLAQPYHFFENIWDQFVEHQNGAIFVATCQNKIIGAGFFLVWQNGLYYKFNTSDHSNLCQRPNDLIVWEGIQYGQARNCSFFDFGLSDWDQDGLIRYKRKFNTEEKTIHFLQHIPDEAALQRQRQIRALFPQITDLFTEPTVPDNVTEKAGGVLYRYFS